MTALSRETIYQAAFGLVTPLLAPGAVSGTLPLKDIGARSDAARPGSPTDVRPFNLISREVVEVQRVPPSLQPVLFMDEAFEEFSESGRGLNNSKFTVYFHIGLTTQFGTPAASMLNKLIDTVLAALAPKPNFDNQDLGLGLAIEDAYPSGLAVKNLGENSTDRSFRQAVCYLPFVINAV